MKLSSVKNTSFLISAGLHLVLFILFLFWKVALPETQQQYVEIGFGMPGGSGGGGGQVEQINQSEDKSSTPSEVMASEQKDKLEKENSQVTQPKTQQKDEEKIVTSPSKEKVQHNTADIKNQNAGTSDIDRAKSNAGFGTNPLGSGIGNGKGSGSGNGNGEGDGNGDGYGIDWGGRGNRRIYSYIVPSYPEGVTKEIDVKLKFAIRPDGTVGTIIPLMKVDTRLENVAIKSLQQWRFEPLRAGNIEQWAIIVFPFRLQ